MGGEGNARILGYMMERRNRATSGVWASDIKSEQ